MNITGMDKKQILVMQIEIPKGYNVTKQNNLIRYPDNVDKPLPGCYNYGRKNIAETR